MRRRAPRLLDAPLRRMTACDPAEDDAARQTVLGEATHRLARAIEAGNDAAGTVDNLRIGVGVQARQSVVQDRRRPRREEWRLAEFEVQRLAAELVLTGIDP